MKTNTKKVKDAIRLHILKAIDFSEYDNTYTNDVNSVWRAYELEAGPCKGNIQDHFINHIQGLPSYFNLPYWTEDIINVMENEFNLLQPANKSDYDSATLYYHLIYRELKSMLKN